MYKYHTYTTNNRYIPWSLPSDCLHLVQPVEQDHPLVARERGRERGREGERENEERGERENEERRERERMRERVRVRERVRGERVRGERERERGEREGEEREGEERREKNHATELPHPHTHTLTAASFWLSMWTATAYTFCSLGKVRVM